MKGFVFTLDALFALIIAASGVAVLLYFVYSTSIPYQLQYSSTGSFMLNLASEKLSSLAGIPLVSSIAHQESSSNQTWVETNKNVFNDAGNQNGPNPLLVEYTFNASAIIANGTILADYGNIYFASDNLIYAINITSGNVIWTEGSPPITSSSQFGNTINSTAIYDGMLVYLTPGNLVAINAHNGSLIWAKSININSRGHEQINENNLLAFSPLRVYNNRIIFSIYDQDGDRDSNLFSYYANNGTLADTVKLDIIPFISVADGQIAAYISSFVFFFFETSSLNLLTFPYNSTYSSVKIWPSPQIQSFFVTISNMATYANVIAVGQDDDEFLFTISGTQIKDIDLAGQTVTGTSIYGGHIIYQTTSSVGELNTSGSQIWSTNIPPLYSTGYTLYNATPVISSHNVYTIWPTGYILIQNLSTGAIIGNVLIPYSYPISNGAVNPYIALAYGRLIASVGTRLIVFGTCSANPNDSVLSAVATLYANGEGSCASYILSKIQPNSNYSISVNNPALYPKSNNNYYVASFNGINSNVTIQDSNALDSKEITLTAWLYPTSCPSSFSRIISKDTYSSNPHSGWTLLFNANGQCSVYAAFNPGGGEFDSGTVNLVKKSWNFVALSYNGFAPMIYLNGVANDIYGMGVYTPSPSPLVIGCGDSDVPCSNGAFNGLISDVQIYNTSLQPIQISTLYSEGPGAPPIDYRNATAWVPLEGDGNSYGSILMAGFPFNLAYTSNSYVPLGLQNAQSVSAQSVSMPILNYSTGIYHLYNVSVYSWK